MSVRAAILREARTRLESLPWVHAVVDAVAQEASLAEASTAQKVVIDMLASSSELVGEPDQQGTRLRHYVFELIVVVHWTSGRLAGVTGQQPGMLDTELAALMHDDIYRVIVGRGPDLPGGAPGVERLGGTALSLVCLGGGMAAPMSKDEPVLAMESTYLVQYRHDVMAPEVAR